jgi:hypothetical protein
MGRRIVTVGAVGGALGAIVMAMYAMIAAATYQHTGFFTPLYHIASPIIQPARGVQFFSRRRHPRAGVVSSSAVLGSPFAGKHTAHVDDREAEISNLVEYSVQRRLIWKRAREDGRVSHDLDPHAFEPIRPPLMQDAFHPNLVVSGPSGPTHERRLLGVKFLSSRDMGSPSGRYRIRSVASSPSPGAMLRRYRQAHPHASHEGGTLGWNSPVQGPTGRNPGRVAPTSTRRTQTR